MRLLRPSQILAAVLLVALGIVFQLFSKEDSGHSVPVEEKLLPAVSFIATSTIVDLSATTGTTKLPSSTSTVIVTNAMVVRVVDGDTIDVRMDGEDHDEKVRFLGINTPETVDPRRAMQCFGKQASNFTKELLTGKRVRLDPDSQADERDKYHRLLRNIVLPDGTDVNASLVRSGYAYAYVSFPLNKERKKQLLRLQSEAEAMKRGLWADETCAGQK